jgi:hypothetical protein
MLNKIINKFKGDKKMDNQQFYTLGEMLEKIEQGYYGISTAYSDEGTIFSVDENNKVFAIFEDQNYKSHYFGINKTEDTKPKHYIIKEVDEEIQELFDSLEFKHTVDIWLEENEEKLKQHYWNEIIIDTMKPIVKQYGVEAAFVHMKNIADTFGIVYKQEDIDGVNKWLQELADN